MSLVETKCWECSEVSMMLPSQEGKCMKCWAKASGPTQAEIEAEAQARVSAALGGSNTFMKPCGSCGKMVSKSATFCMNCGAQGWGLILNNTGKPSAGCLTAMIPMLLVPVGATWGIGWLIRYFT